MTPERIAAAARLVAKGQIFPLDMPLCSIDPGVAYAASDTILRGDEVRS
jgi:hypothetical protein